MLLKRYVVRRVHGEISESEYKELLEEPKVFFLCLLENEEDSYVFEKYDKALEFYRNMKTQNTIIEPKKGY